MPVGEGWSGCPLEYDIIFLFKLTIFYMKMNILFFVKNTISKVKFVSVIFHHFAKWKPFKIYKKKCFLFQLKSSFPSWDIQIFVIFIFAFHTFQIQKDKWEWNNLRCHELAWIILADAIFGITQKLLHITSSNLVRSS